MAGFRYDREKEGLVSVTGEECRTKFIVMKEGAIVFFGTRQELEAAEDPYVKRFVKHED